MITKERVGRFSWGEGDIEILTVEKINPCHNQSDGKFCSTGGGGRLEPGDKLRGSSSVWQRKLNAPERNAVKDYTESSSKVNTALRRGTPVANKDQVEHIDNAISKYTVKEDMTVYRAMVKPGHVIEPGQTFTDRGYPSTSVDQGVAMKFYASADNHVLMRVKIPTGKHAAPINGFSDYPTEQEVLLPRNTTFRVTNVSKVFNPKYGLNVNVVDAEVI